MSGVEFIRAVLDEERRWVEHMMYYGPWVVIITPSLKPLMVSPYTAGVMTRETLITNDRQEYASRNLTVGERLVMIEGIKGFAVKELGIVHLRAGVRFSPDFVLCPVGVSYRNGDFKPVLPQVGSQKSS